VKPLCQALVKLALAIGDAELIKEGIDFADRLMRAYQTDPTGFEDEVRYENGMEVRYHSPFKTVKKIGLEKEVKSLLLKLTARLNKLTGGENQNEEITEARVEELVRTIKSAGVRENDLVDDTPAQAALTGSLINSFALMNNARQGNLLNSPEFPISPEEYQQFYQKALEELKDSMTKTENPSKWYENKLTVGLLIGGGLLVIGLAV